MAFVVRDRVEPMRLDNGDVTFTTDFRSVYTTVVERWLGRPASGIIAGSFPTLPVLG